LTARHSEFERVILPHSRSLLRVARRVATNAATAEDLVQETLLRAWRAFEQLRPNTNARAWLFRILFNAFYAQGRKLRSGPVLVSLEDSGTESEGINPRRVSWTDAAIITRALGDLSEEHRTVLMLGPVEGFTCREMAEILAVPIGTVMSRLSRARKAFREQLAPSAAQSGGMRLRMASAEREAL
jgi:RNA polymerase sigma-70 factor, ECF subfamily